MRERLLKELNPIIDRAIIFMSRPEEDLDEALIGRMYILKGKIEQGDIDAGIELAIISKLLDYK
jgi:hypothetical protein